MSVRLITLVQLPTRRSCKIQVVFKVNELVRGDAKTGGYSLNHFEGGACLGRLELVKIRTAYANHE